MYYFVLILLVIAAVYPFLEPHFLGTEEINIELENAEDVKIAHLTDLHSRGFGSLEKKVLKKLERIDPDYIFITGDFVDKRTQDLEACQNFWKVLVDQHPNKVFGVLGNHEYSHGRTKKIIELLEESGVKLLNNEAVEIDEITLAGVKSPHLDRDELNFNKEVDILLAHSPEIFRRVKNKKIGIILTGHTHGGQVNIPILSRLVLPMRYGKKYKEGLFKEQGTYMYVNRGIGTTILPIRFNAPPVIGLIDL